MSLEKNCNVLTQSIHGELRQRGIAGKFKPPTASHMGGVWERLIRSARKILSALVSGQTLTDEGLATLMVEVEAILNSRPLTPVTFDPNDNEPLTPNHLCFKLVPRLQHQVFSERTTVMFVDVGGKYSEWQISSGDTGLEYLPTLLPRQKWTTKRNNIQLGDVALIAGDGHSRSNWQMGRVLRVFPDSRIIVRQVEVKTANGAFRRPIAKLRLVCRGDEKITASISVATISD